MRGEWSGSLTDTLGHTEADSACSDEDTVLVCCSEGRADHEAVDL